MTPLSEILRKYWALLLGAMLLGFFGFRLWLGPLPRVHRPTDLVPGEEVPGSFDAEGAEAQASSRPAEDLDRPNDASAAAQDTPQHRYQMVEMLIPLEASPNTDAPPRTLTQDSPEVKSALSEMTIEIYAVPGSADAEQAQEFLSHNHLNFIIHDTAGDAMASERARRLSQAPTAHQGTLVVVDGQVMQGYSTDGIQDLLRNATRKRVLEGSDRGSAAAAE